jgi:hypothetical protein
LNKIKELGNMAYVPKMLEGAIWKTQTGVLLSPKEMTDSHLKNTLQFLQKPQTVENLKGAAFVERLLLPMPESGGASDAYLYELTVMEKTLADMPSEEYFETYIKPSKLYQAMLKELGERVQTIAFICKECDAVAFGGGR